jgi:hypothetical protein
MPEAAYAVFTSQLVATGTPEPMSIRGEILSSPEPEKAGKHAFGLTQTVIFIIG